MVVQILARTFQLQLVAQYKKQTMQRLLHNWFSQRGMSTFFSFIRYVYIQSIQSEGLPQREEYKYTVRYASCIESGDVKHSYLYFSQNATDNRNDVISENILNPSSAF